MLVLLVVISIKSGRGSESSCVNCQVKVRNPSLLMSEKSENVKRIDYYQNRYFIAVSLSLSVLLFPYLLLCRCGLHFKSNNIRWKIRGKKNKTLYLPHIQGVRLWWKISKGFLGISTRPAQHPMAVMYYIQ